MKKNKGTFIEANPPPATQQEDDVQARKTSLTTPEVMSLYWGDTSNTRTSLSDTDHGGTWTAAMKLDSLSATTSPYSPSAAKHQEYKPTFGFGQSAASAYLNSEARHVQKDGTKKLTVPSATKGDAVSSLASPPINDSESLHRVVDSSPTSAELRPGPLSGAVKEPYPLPDPVKSTIHDVTDDAIALHTVTSDAPTAPVYHLTTILGAIDDVGPVTGNLANGATTDDTQPTLYGTGHPGAVLSVGATVHAEDGQDVIAVVFPLGEVQVQSDGTWKHTLPEALKNGAYDFHVRSGEEVAHFTLTIDDGLPIHPPVSFETAILGAIDDVGPVTGNLANGATTDDTQPTLYGTGHPGAVLSVGATVHAEDGQDVIAVVFPLGEVQVQSDGTWKHTLPEALKNGAYDFHVRSGEEVAHFTLTIDDGLPIHPPVSFETAILGAIDDVGPVIGAIADGGVTDDATPTRKGGGLLRHARGLEYLRQRHPDRSNQRLCLWRVDIQTESRVDRRSAHVHGSRGWHRPLWFMGVSGS